MDVLPSVYVSCSRYLCSRSAATYTLVYTFLTKHSHTKAAEALKKAARDVVVLKEDGSSLEDIVREWKEFKVQVRGVNPRPSEETSSQDDCMSKLQLRACRLSFSSIILRVELR